MLPTATQEEMITTVKAVLAKLRDDRLKADEIEAYSRAAHNLLALDVVKTAIERQIHHEATDT